MSHVAHIATRLLVLALVVASLGCTARQRALPYCKCATWKDSEKVVVVGATYADTYRWIEPPAIACPSGVFVARRDCIATGRARVPYCAAYTTTPRCQMMP